MANESHNLGVVLASRAEDANVAGVGIWRAEFTDNERDVRVFADWVFSADEDIEWFAWACFAEPWLEIIEELGDILNTLIVREFWLRKELLDARKIELIADGGKSEITCELD